MATTVKPIGDWFREADPINLIRAICIVYYRWERAKKKPRSDNTILSPVRREELLSDVRAVWYELADLPPAEDDYPYRKSFVLRHWINLGKMSDKEVWIKASLQDCGLRYEEEEQNRVLFGENE